MLMVFEQSSIIKMTTLKDEVVNSFQKEGFHMEKTCSTSCFQSVKYMNPTQERISAVTCRAFVNQGVVT